MAEVNTCGSGRGGEMQVYDDSAIDDAFVEDAGAVLDPDDHYKLLEVASGRTAIPTESDLHWTSSQHYVGRFWVVRPRHGQPEIVSFRRAFKDAELLDNEFLALDPYMSFDRCWEMLGDDEQHLTPHQRSCVESARSNYWPRGYVEYVPRLRTWFMSVPAELVDDEATLLAVRQRFVIDPTCCRVVATSN
ncbi:hypothetical protein [Brevundimonas diminuta]|uniref:hypothetical protein n=1 Tax=Brevundimonas diminuta TaxID=293 RepID=UPI001F580474|nr:hypothetical protein [Brevundimonas diminuta]